LLDQSKLGDALAKSLALLRVGDRRLQRVARAAHAGRSQFETADIQDVEGDDVSLADLAEQVFHRHLAIVENQRASRRSANTQLVLLGADGKTGKIPLNDKRRKF